MHAITLSVSPQVLVEARNTGQRPIYLTPPDAFYISTAISFLVYFIFFFFFCKIGSIVGVFLEYLEVLIY